ncbi:MAG TPA: nickel pincer cofactor biosynthesis protein LarC [Acidimicrobiales bacterium]|nr:nickel pincer cofactor biosynthesis protein LarC [Acidimicrobiales bacterium]
MKRLAWFHCFAGIAGDMAVGSLIDAGADLAEVVAILRRLPVGGWEVSADPVTRGGLAATHFVVRTSEDGVVRTHSHIIGLIEEARLPDRVRSRSLAAFAALAEAEGRLHRRPPAQVHFHEVGGLDAIVDIVGACAALEVLGVDEVMTSPVATGIGVVRTAHGLLPNPAPAVVELLRGVPSYGRDVPVELTTPTGAALVAALSSAHGPLPAMRIEATGFGAGTKVIDDLPNCTQVVTGLAGADEAPAGQPVVLLETNVDDATGETLAHTVATLLDAGALDAWLTPVVMKKGRPAHVVSALADPALADQVMRVMRDETGSLGVRGLRLERWPVPRAVDEVEVEGLPVRVKVSPGRIKAEHDDAARVAFLRGMPLREVARRAEAAWLSRPDDDDGRGGSPDPSAPTPA